MSERKVLNKYYPPEFDPAKIPKLKLAKERQYTVRIMAPFNMQCKVCNEYIYKGKKFNAKTENVHNENYLGLRIYRFYIRCPRCISEVVFKTDPQQTDYTLEQGAIRLFEAAKLYQAAEEKEKKQAEEDATNPMKVLENRTKDSKLEMEVMENLEELRELNMRQGTINYEEILKQGAEQEALGLKQQEEDDEEEIRRLFGKGGDGIIIKRLDDDDDEDEESPSSSKPSPSSTTFKRPTDILTDEVSGPSGAKKQKLADTSSSRSSTKSSTKSSSRSFLSGLVKVKKSDSSSSSKPDQDNATSSTESSPNQITKPSDTATDAALLTTKPVEGESETSTDAARLTTKLVEAESDTAPNAALLSTHGTESDTATDAAPLSIGGTPDIEKITESAAESDQNSESHSENSDGNHATAEKEEEKEKEEKKKEKKKEKTEEEKEEEAQALFASSIQEGLKKQKVASQKVAKEKSSGLSLLGGYDFSDSDISDSSSDS